MSWGTGATALLGNANVPVGLAWHVSRAEEDLGVPKKAFRARDFLYPRIGRIFTNRERLRRRFLFSILYQSLFEMGLFTAKEGSTAVSAVLRLAQWHEPHPSEPWYPPPHTGGTPVPLSKRPKAIAFRSYSCLFVRLVV